MSISLVAGLGNPGPEYARTRHNLGFRLLDALASQQKLSWQREAGFHSELARWTRGAGRPACLLAKPSTYVNESGRALRRLMDYYKVPQESVIVAYDDLTLPLGLSKVSISGSSGGHNGVESILQQVGDGFVRYRLGIGPKHPAEIDLKDFVLGKFDDSEETLLQQNLSAYLEGLNLLIDSGYAAAMNRLNRRTKTHEFKQEKLPGDLHPGQPGEGRVGGNDD